MGHNEQNRRSIRNLPHELRLMVKAGKHRGNLQWQARLMINDPNFAQPVEARVVINEREWSGPLADGETWIVRPNNYLPEHQLLFCDALYRAEDSAVTMERMWHHPMIIDIYKKMAWDIQGVCAEICVDEIERYQEYRQVGAIGRSMRTEKLWNYRISEEARKRSRRGILKALWSEAGWLMMEIEFSREAPTDEDFYHVEYWTETVRVPLYQCDPQWNLESDFENGQYKEGKQRRFADGSYTYTPAIITRDNRLFTLPRLFAGGERGSHGPFDPSKVGRSDNRSPQVDEAMLDKQLCALMPGKLFRMWHRETANAMGADGTEFIGMVRDVVHHTDGSWEVRFEKNQLWFRQPQWQGGATWECVGKPQRDRDAYDPIYVVPSGQRHLLGFQSLRFRRLVTPEHALKNSDGWNFTGATRFDIRRDDSGRPIGFTGVMQLRGWMLREQGATDRKQIGGQSLAVSQPSGVAQRDERTAGIELYDLGYYETCRDLASAYYIKLPDAIVRRLDR